MTGCREKKHQEALRAAAHILGALGKNYSGHNTFSPGASKHPQTLSPHWEQLKKDACPQNNKPHCMWTQGHQVS